MHLLLETTPLEGAGGGRGLGRYVAQLQRALESRYSVEVFNVPVKEGRFSEIAALPRRQQELWRRPHDLLYSPTPLHVPLWSHSPWVASILDTIPLDVASHRRTGLKTKVLYRMATRADALLTLSHDAASRIADRFDVAGERLVVAPLPCPVRPLSHSAAPFERLRGRPYAVGMIDLATPDPRKRASWYGAVGEAVAEVGYDLVLVGAGTDGRSRIPNTVGLGRLNDEQWSRVLSNAAVFVYCSAFEGQGLPPLEAMAHGTPVVAMSNTAVSEVVADAGLLVAESAPPGIAASAPHSPADAGAKAIARAVVSLLRDSDERRRLSVAGRERAGYFSPDRFSEAVWRAAEIAMAGRGVEGCE